MRTLLWFRNDLRLHDNAALNTAVTDSQDVVPVYVLDERLLQIGRWGFPRLGPYRLRFLLESLADLKDYLKEKGSNLIVKVGVPEEVVPALADQWDCGQVYAAHGYAHEEQKIEKVVAAAVDLRLFHSTTLYDPTDMPFSLEKLPEVFTAFRKKVEKYAEVPEPLATPDKVASPDLPDDALPTLESLGITLPPADKRAVLPFKGGAEAAFKRLDHYFWNQELLSTYKETRNGLIGADYSSKFSPWLANGSISVRSIYHEVNAYEAEVEENKSTYWLKFELLWREYFKFVTMKHGRRIFFPGGIQDKSVNWQDRPKQFHRWATGTTDDAFVDANMRELLRTGFMSNRGRQNVASYLVHRFKEDWRKGAAWFEYLLIDYDVDSNYGNWMYASGVGNDPRDRVFNTKRQADMYDKKGEYRTLWLEDSEEATQAFFEEYLQSAQQTA